MLYAQWSRTESALCIDPAGGSYRNNREITVLPGDYGSVCQLDMEKLVPPQGCRVSFDTRGGEPVDSIVSGQLFREWSVTMPFYGKLQDNTYLYLGDDGTEDRITALYTMQSIVLPEAHRRDQSFGGWFYDADCTSPAGAAGDHFTPLEDITLYAGWVELRLQSQENYSANRGEELWISAGASGTMRGRIISCTSGGKERTGSRSVPPRISARVPVYPGILPVPVKRGVTGFPIPAFTGLL